MSGFKLMAVDRLKISYDKADDVLHGARVVTPPSPILRGALGLPPNRVVSVAVHAGDDVRWIWTHTLKGSSYASGYKLVAAPYRKKARSKRRNSKRSATRYTWLHAPFCA
jgi:hypothetical protein